jgi:hypothetical protein
MNMAWSSLAGVMLAVDLDRDKAAKAALSFVI